MLISDFLSEIKKKCLKNSVLSYSLKLVDMQMLVDSLSGLLYFVWKIIEKMLKMTQKGWKRPKKYFNKHKKAGQNSQHL